ncbi:MAG: hypothetical protein LBQ31_03445 [Bacteroidales bacterium]|nr:hypothetical protein [Bacteroidales bacterium]
MSYYGVSPPSRSFVRGRAFRCNLFANPHDPHYSINRHKTRYHSQNNPSAKRISAAIPNASPRTAPARADYVERERLHCEAIIPNAAQRPTPAPTDSNNSSTNPSTRNAAQRPTPSPNRQQQLINQPLNSTFSILRFTFISA